MRRPEEASSTTLNSAPLRPSMSGLRRLRYPTMWSKERFSITSTTIVLIGPLIFAAGCTGWNNCNKYSKRITRGSAFAIAVDWETKNRGNQFLFSWNQENCKTNSLRCEQYEICLPEFESNFADLRRWCRRMCAQWGNTYKQSLTRLIACVSSEEPHFVYQNDVSSRNPEENLRSKLVELSALAPACPLTFNFLKTADEAIEFPAATFHVLAMSRSEALKAPTSTFLQHITSLVFCNNQK